MCHFWVPLPSRTFESNSGWHVFWSAKWVSRLWDNSVSEMSTVEKEKAFYEAGLLHGGKTRFVALDQASYTRTLLASNFDCRLSY